MVCKFPSIPLNIQKLFRIRTELYTVLSENKWNATPRLVHIYAFFIWNASICRPAPVENDTAVLISFYRYTIYIYIYLNVCKRLAARLVRLISRFQLNIECRIFAVLWIWIEVFSNWFEIYFNIKNYSNQFEYCLKSSKILIHQSPQHKII